jgi:PAS domain S-box-containing protein
MAMSDSAVNDDLPDAVVNFLQRLERITGRIPIARAVVAILVVGLLLTSLVTGAVWWAEEFRAQQAFESTTHRLQELTQERLDHRLSMVHQLADWVAHQPRATGREASWTSGRLSVIGPDALEAGHLKQLMPVDAAQATAIKSCVARLSANHRTALCRAAHPASSSEDWYLVEMIGNPASGWVILPIQASDLNVSIDDGLYWQTWARLAGLQAQPTPADQDALLVQGRAQKMRMQSVHVAGSDLQVQLSGVARERTWADWLVRQAAIWVASGSGVLFTLVGLHVYLMLISTRRRAKEMAREMSAALHHTQSRNQAVMDTAPDAMIMTNGDGLVRWCNQATTSLFGRTLQELAGQHIGQILPALASNSIDQWFATHGYSNRVIGFDSTGYRAEGTAFPVALSARRVEVDGEQIQTFIVRDTTDAKWAEQELLLRDRALASSADGVIITSMTLPNQPIIYVNRAFEQITGYEADEVLGLNCKLLQREDVNQPGIGAMRQAIKEGKGCQVVVRNYRKDGSLFYNDLAISPVLSPEGVVTHFVGVQNDITDRIAAEQVLHLRTERLNAVFDLSPDGFVVLDKRGEVSIVNPSFERMTGMRAGDLVGQSLMAFEEELMSRCKASEVDDASVTALTGAGSSDSESGLSGRQLLHMHTPTARTLVRRVRHGEHDNETVMYFRDITHEQEVDRMKSEFLAMAAHELRTPMVSIFGFTELLLKRNFNDERRQDVLGTIHKQASILINLVNELLDLARIEARRGKDFNRRLQPIGPIIDQALDGLKVPGDRRKVRVHVSSTDTQVWADTDKLGQAVLNVLSNAYKYSPQGGDINLRMSFDDDAQHLLIEVEDHGIGMTEEQLGRVFERFFRADPSGNIPGTGLGMSLVKEIVHLHQGDVQVLSEFGAGTTVRLSIPAQAPPETRGIEAHTKVSTG